MANVNKIVSSNPPAAHGSLDIRLSLQEIEQAKQQFIERNMSLSREEFAGMFGKEIKWACERMKDGSVVVLDEFAKKTENGFRFSKSARICAASAHAYRDSVIVPVNGDMHMEDDCEE